MRDIRAVIEELNPILRGWGAYFRTGNAARHFQRIDRYVAQFLVRWLRRRRCHQGRCCNHRPVRWWSGWPQARFVADFGLHKLLGTIRYPGPSHAA